MTERIRPAERAVRAPGSAEGEGLRRRERWGTQLPAAVFEADLVFHVAPRLAYTPGIPPAIAALSDQGALAHDAAQPTPANQPTLAADMTATFDGANTWMAFAPGGGWALTTSHTWAFLLDPTAAAATLKYVISSSAPAIVLAQCTFTSGKIGYHDGTWRHVADATTGRQILIWRFNAATATGQVLRGNASALASLGTQPYTAMAPAGEMVLGARHSTYVSALPMSFAEGVCVKGARTDAELDYLAKYLRRSAAKIGWTL